jgi:hypothetical protein
MLITANINKVRFQRISELYRLKLIKIRLSTEAKSKILSKIDSEKSTNLELSSIESQKEVLQNSNVPTNNISNDKHDDSTRSSHVNEEKLGLKNDHNETMASKEGILHAGKVDSPEKGFDDLDINFNKTIESEDLSESKYESDSQSKSESDSNDGSDTTSTEGGGGSGSGSASGSAAGTSVTKSTVGPRDTDGFVIPETMAIVDESSDLLEFAQNSFEEFCKAKAKYVVPDELFSHFKSKTRAARAAASSNLYEIYKFRESLQLLYIDAITHISTKFMPITKKHIREIDRAFINKVSNLSSPMAYLEPFISYFCGCAIYGSSLGLHDMVFFEPSEWKDINISFVFDASIDESKIKKNSTKNLINLKIDCISHDGRKFKFRFNDNLRLFQTETAVDWEASHFENSIFANKNPKTACNECFTMSLDGEYVVIVYDTNDTERVGIVSRGSNIAESIVDGFRIHQTVVNDLDIDEFNEDLSRILATTKMLRGVEGRNDHENGLSLAVVDEHSKNSMDGYCAYISSALYQFVSSKVASERTSVIKKIKFTINLQPNISTNYESNSKFKEMVNKGSIVPISPLQILRYLGHYDVEVWRKYVFCSALVGMNLNPIVLTVMPSIASNSKRNMILISIFRDRLESQFYNEEEALDFEKSHNFKITYEQFLKEMLVRMLVSTNTPSYFRFMSEGSWKGSSGSSLTIVAPNFQRVFSKYTLGSIYEEVSDFNYKMALYKIKIDGVKRTARLVNKLPDVFASVVENE